MDPNDIIGLLLIIIVGLALLYGLHRITRPTILTQEEYEKRLRKSSGIARGAMNALMYPLEELLHPKAVEAIHVQKDLRQGYYDAPAGADEGFDAHAAALSQGEKSTERRPQASKRIDPPGRRPRALFSGSLLRRALLFFRSHRSGCLLLTRKRFR